jgi:hypothetical protein
LDFLWWNRSNQLQFLNLVWAFALPGFISGLPGDILSVVGDVPVNSEALMVTLSTLRSAGSVLRRCL